MSVPNKAARIKAEIKTLRDQIDRQFAEYKEHPDSMPEDVITQLEKWDDELGEKLEAYSEAAQKEQKARDNREAMTQIFASNGHNEPTTDGNREPEAKSNGHGYDRKTIETVAEQVLHQPEFKQWFDQMTRGGTQKMADGVGVRSPVVGLENSLLEQKALITGLSSTSGGALVVNDRLSTIVPAVRDELNIIDLVSRQTTQSDTVEYVRVTGETNNAAPVLEATSVSTGAKPESAVALAVVTAIVENIAHWIPITRRAASDASQLMSYINDFLVFGLLQELDNQIVNGNGTSPQLEGIANTTGVQTQAFDTDILTTTRKARTKVRTVGGAVPTAYAMSALLWEEIDLTQDNENRYYFGGPQRIGTPVLWGLPVVESEVLPEDTAYVADWRMAVLWDRQQATIHMTDSHSDFFVRNILVILAELRAAFGILRPQAFVEIATVAGP